jgi:hypothetical protein
MRTGILELNRGAVPEDDHRRSAADVGRRASSFVQVAQRLPSLGTIRGSHNPSSRDGTFAHHCGVLSRIVE